MDHPNQIGSYTLHDGEVIVRLFLIPVAKEADVAKDFPATRCHHDFDCCGQYYDYEGEVIYYNDDCPRTAIVKQVSYLNV